MKASDFIDSQFENACSNVIIYFQYAHVDAIVSLAALLQI